MASDRKIRLTPPSSEPSKYEVGYGRPPKASQFTPGRSGNPKGRPKGARNKLPGPHEERLTEIIIEEAYRTIKVSEGKRQITIPLAKAAMRALAINAARGQLRSRQVFTKLLSETERERKALINPMLETAIAYKDRWDRELERRKKLGITGREPLPHPDDVHVDIKNGHVSFKGPTNKEDKAEWDKLYDEVEELDREIELLNADMNKTRSKRYRSSLESEIADDRRIRQMIVNAIGEPSLRRRK